MSLVQVRSELAHALKAAVGAPLADDRLRDARQVLIRRGAEVLGIDPASVPGPADVIGLAASAPASPARRAFAVLIVDALAVPGLLAAQSPGARLDRDVCALLEAVLPDVLWRAGYPFGGDADTRRRWLTTLPGSIDEHLRPLEPTFPGWLSGLPQP